MKLNLPKKYLSHSQINLWLQDRGKYRKRYYEGEKGFESVYAMFGREVHEKIENKEILLPYGFKQCRHEVEIKVNVSGVPMLGYLDLYRKRDGFFADIKSGIRKPDGSPRYTQYDVEKCKQLSRYAVLIEEKFGKTFRFCKLIWFETRFKKITEQIGSQTLETESNELELTGHPEVFKREIYPHERNEARNEIIRVAKAISKDYTAWLKNN